MTNAVSPARQPASLGRVLLVLAATIVVVALVSPPDRMVCAL
jgi:hypothetical protein